MKEKYYNDKNDKEDILKFNEYNKKIIAEKEQLNKKIKFIRKCLSLNPFKISDISKVQNDVVRPNNIEEQNKTSKLAKMYIDMIEVIMERDQGLQENIKFLAIDFSNFRRPLTEKEKAEKYKNF